MSCGASVSYCATNRKESSHPPPTPRASFPDRPPAKTTHRFSSIGNLLPGIPATQEEISVADKDSALRQQLTQLIKGGNAHVDYKKALADFPAEIRGKRPKGSPHSPWELLEHLRIAQWDILEYSRNAQHKSPNWPSGYWPEFPEPPDPKAWDRSVNSFCQDLQSFCKLVEDEASDLFAPLPADPTHTLLREALLVADHNAYHLGQLVLLRKELGAWSEE
ncbi:DinB family protein [Acidobacteria bacterium AB60]|nr:DinB family protein [Acidobacteria bacterium AB60]